MIPENKVFYPTFFEILPPGIGSLGIGKDPVAEFDEYFMEISQISRFDHPSDSFVKPQGKRGRYDLGHQNGESPGRRPALLWLHPG